MLIRQALSFLFMVLSPQENLGRYEMCRSALASSPVSAAAPASGAGGSGMMPGWPVPLALGLAGWPVPLARATLAVGCVWPVLLPWGTLAVRGA